MLGFASYHQSMMSPDVSWEKCKGRGLVFENSNPKLWTLSLVLGLYGLFFTTDSS
jgi:hypothetical protein